MRNKILARTIALLTLICLWLQLGEWFSTPIPLAPFDVFWAIWILGGISILLLIHIVDLHLYYRRKTPANKP